MDDPSFDDLFIGMSPTWRREIADSMAKGEVFCGKLPECKHTKTPYAIVIMPRDMADRVEMIISGALAPWQK